MSEAWRAFAHPSASSADLCAGVRWIAPYVPHAPDDDLVLEALELAERLGEPVASLCLWWIHLRRRDVVHERAYATCRELPEDLREVLVWVARADGDGLASYRAAYTVAAPYEQALRALKRATREYASLAPVEAAIRGGRADVSSVIASIPGGWHSAALKAYRATINDAVDARRCASAAGVDATFPIAAVPRFTALEAEERSLCLDLLSGLPGSRGACLEKAERTCLNLTEGDVGRRAVQACEFEDRGLPVTPITLGADYWSFTFGDASDEAVSYFASRNPLAKMSRGLVPAMTGPDLLASWLAELVAAKSEWGAQWTNVLDKTFLAASAAGLLPQLMELWEKEDPWDATRRLVEALRDLRNADLSLLALSRQLETTATTIRQYRKEPSWV